MVIVDGKKSAEKRWRRSRGLQRDIAQITPPCDDSRTAEDCGERVDLDRSNTRKGRVGVHGGGGVRPTLGGY